MANNIQDSINKAIDTIIAQRINALALDKTVIAIIDRLVDPLFGVYRVKYDGGYFNARVQQTGAVYLKGMSVYVQIPQNDMTKEKIIIGRAYASRSSELANSVISAINSYSIMGGNLLTGTDNLPEKFGLRSYHDPKVEINNPAAVSHRAYFIYQDDIVAADDYYDFDYSSLDIYRDTATGLMLEADFKTSLSSEQKNKANGKYGIGLNLVFENSTYQYGETEEEIFNYFAPQIQSSVEVINNNVTVESPNEYITITKSIEDYANDFRTNIGLIGNVTVSVEELLKTDGLIDVYQSYIRSIADSYAANNPNLYTDLMETTVVSFLQLLSDIKTLYSTSNTLAEIRQEYTKWANLQVAPPKEKIVTYVLDSNMMTGAPYAFSSWSTQYNIFNIDFKNFKRIDSIIFFKDGFVLDESKDSRIEEDIFVQNIRLYALQPISAINGDYSLKIKASQGLIFKDEENMSDEDSLKLQGEVLKQYQENLSDEVSFLWFKANGAVTSVGHDDYNPYGGLGWRYLIDKGNKKTFEVFRYENSAYENHYKCVAVVDKSIVLNQEFIIYNEAAGDNLTITSDLGTHFTFDIGRPILTVYSNEEEKIPVIEIDDEGQENIIGDYRYSWAIVVNGQTTFLDGQEVKLGAFPTSTTDVITAQNLAGLTKNIKFYAGDVELDTDHINLATRIAYPISNIATESSAIFECYVQKRNVDVGKASISIFNSTQGSVIQYKITIEGGEQIFQYDEYGSAPNDKKLKDPQEIKPLSCHFFNPTGLEVGNSNYSVQWILPIENTLITSNINLQPNAANNFNLEIDPNMICEFGIAALYDESCQNNQIICRIIYNGEVYEKSTNFFFGKIGSNGTNGTDMVLRLEPVLQGGILDKEPLTLYRSELNPQTKIYRVLTLNDGTTVRDEEELPISKTHLRGRLFQKNDEISLTEEAIKWNVAGSTTTTRNNKGKYLKAESNSAGSSLIWNESYQPDKLENYIIRAQVDYSTDDSLKTYYAFYGLPIITYNGTLPRVSRLTIDKKFLLKEIVYNADGRNPIYSHTQGVKINNVPIGGYIEWRAIGGAKNSSETCCFSLLVNKDDNQGLAYIAPEAQLKQVYILPNDEYLGSYSNNRVEAKVYKSNGELLATVIVPIHMSLNTFGLASLNAWDGNTVTIDEENGYVMAPQIGAGEKDSNNRFTGILMGKTETYTGASTGEEETGLFGYAHGLQSIFLDANTGDATFGLPDGKILTENGNTLIPRDSKNSDDYTEGRIELRPGGESKIGGWRIGRRGLYYTRTGTLEKRTLKDWAPNKTGRLSLSEVYYKHHDKDIRSIDTGILLYSGTDPYISVKGRPLREDEVATDLNSKLYDGDSLEIQLDPQTPTLFTVFRHDGPLHNNGDISREGHRTFLAGINYRGELVANAIQNNSVDPSTGQELETRRGIDFLYAFADNPDEAPTYVGVKHEVGQVPFFKAFVKAPENETDAIDPQSTLYITSGDYYVKGKNNEYPRPISIHGREIKMYANWAGGEEGDDLETDAKFLLTESPENKEDKFLGFMGKKSANSFLELRSATQSSLYAGANLDILGSTVEIKSRNNSDGIHLITLSQNGEASTLSLHESNGLIGGIKGPIELKNDKNILLQSNYGLLEIKSQTATLKLNDSNYLTLNGSTSAASSNHTWQARGNINILSKHQQIQLESTSAQGLVGSKDPSKAGIYLRTVGATGYSTELHLYGGQTAQNKIFAALDPNSLPPVLYQTGIKPGEYIDDSTKNGPEHTAGLSVINTAAGRRQGGIATNWMHVAGNLYTEDGQYSQSGHHLTNVGLYVNNGIRSDSSISAGSNIHAGGMVTANGDIRTNVADSNKTVSLYNHTHPFNKGLSVSISDGNSQSFTITQHDATAKAELKIVATSRTNCSHTFGYNHTFKANGGEWTSGSFQYQHQQYKSVSGYIKPGPEHLWAGEPVYYKRECTTATGLFEHDGSSEWKTATIAKNKTISAPSGGVNFRSFSANISDITSACTVTENCTVKHDSKVNDQTFQTEVKGTSASPKYNLTRDENGSPNYS